MMVKLKQNEEVSTYGCGLKTYELFFHDKLSLWWSFLIKYQAFQSFDWVFDLNIFLCKDIQNVFWFSIVDDGQTRLQ
jgi:hypothetical protein